MTTLNYKTIGIILVIAIFPLLLNQAYAELTFASIIKSADEIVTNSTVLQNDDELFFIANSNRTYSFAMQTIVSGESSTNMKMAFTVPSGATMKWHVMNVNPTTLTPFVSGEVGSGIREERLIFMAGTDPDRLQLTELYGTVKMGTTSGTVQFQWSQEFASLISTTMFEGSSLRVYESGATQTGDGIGLGLVKVVKSIDQSVVNTTVFEDDDEIFFTCEADRTYTARLSIFSDTDFQTDWLVRWTIPTGATARILDDVYRMSSTQQMVDATASKFQNGGIIGESQHTIGEILFKIGSTTGTCQFQFTQAVSTNDPVTILAGTMLQVWDTGTTSASDFQGEQGIQGIQGIQGEKGDKGSAGSGGGSVGSVPAPAPTLTETELVELVLAQLPPPEPTVFTPIIEPLESVVQTFFEFAVVDSTLGELTLNSLVQNERLGIRWSSGQDILILGAIPSPSPFQITFEQFPVVKQGSGAVISTDFLRYNLQVPNVLCTNTITTSCVNPVRYEIPVTINGVIGDSQVSDTGTITVDLREDVLDPILLLLLASFGIPIIGIIIQRARGRSIRIPARRVAGL